LSLSPCGPLPAELRRHLSTARLGRRVYFYPETDSTNDVALELARRGEPDGTIVVADYQRRGRGRRGSVWSSPRGSDLLVSLILRPEGEVRGVLAITLLVATAISVALSKLLDREIGVEWPNDVVSEEGKIAGVLAECASSSREVAYIVVGAGINVNSSAAEIVPPARAPAASCRSLTGVTWDRSRVLSDVLGGIEAYYDRFRRDGFAPLRAACESRLRQMGRAVVFERGGVRRSGRARGVALDGALRVALEDGTEVELYNETVEVRV
jgi:BirA family biotin operon repressor/biotin-[acetyl-CoA-carboxylase] ligase